MIYVRAAGDKDDRTDWAFEEAWDKENVARKALIEQLKLLADMEHPPRKARS